MTAALDTLDFGPVITAEDRAAVEAFDRLCRDDWASFELAALARETAGLCLVCGAGLDPQDGVECTDCAIAHDSYISRLTDI